jgi:hypothetical protein
MVSGRSSYRSSPAFARQSGAEIVRERDRAVRRKLHTEQWYAVRLERLKDLAKERGIWPEVACIIANGTMTGMRDGAFVYDPPTYAQQLNSALGRLEMAQKEIARLKRRLGEPA